MIRNAESRDIDSITDIYNWYIVNGTATFEIEPVTREEMADRIDQISATHPYMVYEEDGQVLGYCYAHPWKARAAYQHTLETTVYVHHEHQHKGIGRQLMEQLVADCRNAGYKALIACITEGNEGSCALHRALGFTQVSEFKEVGNKFGQWLGVVDFELLLK